MVADVYRDGDGSKRLCIAVVGDRESTKSFLYLVGHPENFSQLQAMAWNVAQTLL